MNLSSNDWIYRTSMLVAALPVTIVLAGILVDPDSQTGQDAFMLSKWLLGIGVLLAVGTFAFVAVTSFRGAEEIESDPTSAFYIKMRVWGLSALCVYILAWLGMIAWIMVHHERETDHQLPKPTAMAVTLSANIEKT